MTVRLFGRGLTVPVLTLAVEPGRELCRRGGARGLMTGTHYFKLEPGGTRRRLLSTASGSRDPACRYSGRFSALSFAFSTSA
jgi:hypothetical protein